MKKAKLFFTATAILAIVGSAMAANQKFGAGRIFCFANTATVHEEEGCTATDQPVSARVDFVIGSSLLTNPCPDPVNQTPYQGADEDACTPITGQTFVTTGL